MGGEQYLNTPPPRDRRGMRTGYTTGSTASAAAKAAALALLTGTWPPEVSVRLPIGEVATFQPIEGRLSADEAFCCCIKDAGDDPDVTHGALICATVRRAAQPGVHIEGGEGVGRVTLPGLGLPVGGPAINPVPRQQITANVHDALAQAGDPTGLEVIISVPGGAEIAKKTLNPRLGILGGISILGTTGKVFPYSTAAWRASVIQAVEVAAHNGAGRVVLATGGRTERYAMAIYPGLPPAAFVEMSVFTGAALETCAVHGVTDIALVGMIGKLAKTAQGHMTTHVAGNEVDLGFLAHVTAQAGADAALVAAVRAANTARHFLELCQAHGDVRPLQAVVELAAEQCAAFLQSKGAAGLSLSVTLVDFDEGRPLAQAQQRITGQAGDHSQPGTLIERLAGGDYHEDEEDLQR